MESEDWVPEVLLHWDVWGQSCRQLDKIVSAWDVGANGDDGVEDEEAKGEEVVEEEELSDDVHQQKLSKLQCEGVDVVQIQVEDSHKDFRTRIQASVRFLLDTWLGNQLQEELHVSQVLRTDTCCRFVPFDLVDLRNKLILVNKNLHDFLTTHRIHAQDEPHATDSNARIREAIA